MIHTLRIAGIAVVILAGVVMASVAVPAWRFGLAGHDDGQVEKILNAPSAVDRFQKQYGDKVNDDQDTTPPLVREAKIFASILNPPASDAAPARTTASHFKSKPTVKPPVSSARFDLVGTSYSATDPASSFAYIRLQDRTYQWVRQGDEVGHSVIREIRSGSIIYWDGRQDIQMLAEATADTSSILESNRAVGTAAASGFPPDVSGGTPSNPSAQPANSVRPIHPNPVPGSVAGTPVTTPGSLTAGDQEALSELVNRLKESDMDPASKAAAVSRLISQFKAQRVSPQEAEKLESLGEELNGDQKGREASIENRRREFLRRMSTPRSPGH